jgi:hypothetical protein
MNTGQILMFRRFCARTDAGAAPRNATNAPTGAPVCDRLWSGGQDLSRLKAGAPRGDKVAARGAPPLFVNGTVPNEIETNHEK